MIDKWFKNDLLNILDRHSVAVFIDESGDAEFLLKVVEGEYSIYQTNSEVEELNVKYLIEKAQPSHEKFIIYTRSKKDELKFIREYCETSGCLEVRYMQNYIKDKVHQNLNLNINLSKDELIAAAKVSIGKERTYWMDLSHKGAGEIFDLNKELLTFVHDPVTYSKEKYDAQIRDTFYRKVNELLGQDYLNKPATTLAGEVVKAMLDGLAEGQCNKTLESVYKNWLDSVSYKDSFVRYLDNYKLPSEVNIWNVSIDHPFRQVDERWLAEIGKSISDKNKDSNIIAKLRQRSRSRQAHAVSIHFWNDVIELLDFDAKDIAYLSSFNECTEFYKKHFYKLDTAIRNLYTEFLNKREILEPFQYLYKEHVSILLDKWFEHWSGYKENQTGTLQRIIDGSGSLKTAIIVGDGVAYEIGELVASRVKGAATLTKDSILADIPSETENNMSRIYMDNGVTESIQANREKYLVEQNPKVKIDFIRLDEFNEEALAGQFLICTYKDIDDMGEKLQQKALKYFTETIDFFAEKISSLLSSGYAKVYLISDHGFVLTGLLSESDKISVYPKGIHEKAERYIRIEDRQPDLSSTFIEAAKSYKQFDYVYFAKNINPFKTPGLYGFSHGGLSPQEIITPYFIWDRSEGLIATLPVRIENKEELNDVTGELFSIKLKADRGTDDLFSVERKIYLVFFANNMQVSRSDIFAVQQMELITKEFTFEGHQEIEVQILDASTKQQLDRAVVKKNNDRDLGGLF
jgi:hypothetical protein